MFDEIAAPPSTDKKKKAAPKPITSTSLRSDHLDAAKLLLKTGVACVLKNGEANENTALAVERVASDLLGLTTAVATALNRALKNDADLKGADPVLIKQWCEFYSEVLLPQTRAMVKQTTPKLDAFGLFLPSRMGASVSPDLLQKGMKLDETDDSAEVEEDEEKKDVSTEEEKEATTDNAEEEVAATEDAPPADDEEEIEEEDDVDDDVEEFDEEQYEYDEDEDYYDDEDEL
jgi:hypothetical protein